MLSSITTADTRYRLGIEPQTLMSRFRLSIGRLRPRKQGVQSHDAMQCFLIAFLPVVVETPDQTLAGRAYTPPHRQPTEGKIYLQ